MPHPRSNRQSFATHGLLHNETGIVTSGPYSFRSNKPHPVTPLPPAGVQVRHGPIGAQNWLPPRNADTSGRQRMLSQRLPLMLLRTAETVSPRYGREFAPYKLSSALPDNFHPSVTQRFPLAFGTCGHIFVQDRRRKPLEFMPIRTPEKVVRLCSSPCRRQKREPSRLRKLYCMFKRLFSCTRHILNNRIVSSRTPNIPPNRNNLLRSHLEDESRARMQSWKIS